MQVVDVDQALSLPVVINARDGALEPVAWASTHREEVARSLLRSGAVLFRGFRVNGIAHFERFIAEAFCHEPIGYSNPSTPRTALKGNIYTSTEYPADQHIPLHNENSYAGSWARRIFFYCIKPSEQGGETPIADSRRIYSRISAATRGRLERHGVMYVRNYNGLDLPWQTVFQTDDRAEVESRCRDSSIAFEWLSETHLRTREVAQASLRHPVTGEWVWFNQAHLFHVSNLAPVLRAGLTASVGEAHLPRNAYCGDGGQISDSDLAEIRAAYDAETVMFPWQAGDILLLDNMLTAHGRRPFTGGRKVVVGMIESYSPGSAQHDAQERPALAV